MIGALVGKVEGGPLNDTFDEALILSKLFEVGEGPWLPDLFRYYLPWNSEDFKNQP